MGSGHALPISDALVLAESAHRHSRQTPDVDTSRAPALRIGAGMGYRMSAIGAAWSTGRGIPSFFRCIAQNIADSLYTAKQMPFLPC